jgi:hypothetical protein
VEITGIVINNINQLPPLNRCMKTTTTQCSQCGNIFEKRTADYNKQRRINPDCKFFCTRSCHGKRNFIQLKGKNSFSDNPELQKKASTQAAAKNRKYFGRDLPFSALIRKCKGRNKEVTITLDYLGVLWDKQQGKCALSNIKLDLYSTSYIDQPSIDRIDSTLGYIIGNIQFVSCCINYAKNNMSNDDAIKLIKLIREA